MPEPFPINSPRYWLINDGVKGPLVDTAICFSMLWAEKLPDAICYAAWVNPSLNHHQAFEYARFLNSWLPNEGRYEFRASSLDNKDTIEFTLNCKDLSHRVVLLYLSAFRYVAEQPACIKAFMEGRDYEEDWFKFFQQLHYAVPRVMMHNQLAHGLVCKDTFCASSGVTVGAEEFKKRLLGPVRASVQSYF